ncbi:MAG: carbohydrate kinase [Archaeoglobus sp.]|nr:carbohydrate kinase [Archaeoglobus sp.]
MELVLAFDVGTTSIKCAAVNLDNFEVVSTASTKAKVIHPERDWAEKEPETLWESIVEISRKAAEGYEEEIKALIFVAHMAGIVPISKEGEPLRNIITWLDERAAGLPEDLWKGLLKIQGYNLFKVLKFLRITGGAPSKTGKDVISKIVWIARNEPDVFDKTFKFLDVKGFLISKCTGEFVTSPDEANLTWLADTRGRKAVWSESIMKDYGLNSGKFPEVKLSIDIAGEVNGKVAEEMGVQAGIPVVVGAGDIPSAAIGSGAIGEGDLHIYIGTSDWVAGHLSKRKTDISHYIGSLLSAIPERYLLIAEQEVAAGALEWFLKLIGMEGKYEEVSDLVSKSENNLIFLPWLYGERAPIDDPWVRGGLFNFSLENDKADILRAVMEGVALNIKWAYIFTEKLAAKTQQAVNMVGGGALFDVWCQMVADAIDRPIRRIKNPQETGIRGAAAIAAVSIGKAKSFEEAVAKFEVDKVFKPDKDSASKFNTKFREFEEAYKKLRKIYRRLNG